jgi:hypothetical protein
MSLVDLVDLGRRLQAQVAGSLGDHRAWTSRIETMADVTLLVGLAILGLVFLAVLSVVFATAARPITTMSGTLLPRTATSHEFNAAPAARPAAA